MSRNLCEGFHGFTEQGLKGFSLNTALSRPKRTLSLNCLKVVNCEVSQKCAFQATPRLNSTKLSCRCDNCSSASSTAKNLHQDPRTATSEFM